MDAVIIILDRWNCFALFVSLIVKAQTIANASVNYVFAAAWVDAEDDLIPVRSGCWNLGYAEQFINQAFNR